MTITVGRENRVRQVEHRLSENLEIAVARTTGCAQMHIHLIARDAPVRRSRVTSAGREKTVENLVALTDEFLDLGADQPIALVPVGDRRVGERGRLGTEVKRTFGRMNIP